MTRSSGREAWGLGGGRRRSAVRPRSRQRRHSTVCTTIRLYCSWTGRERDARRGDEPLHGCADDRTVHTGEL